MHHHLHPAGRQVEQTASLDDLESLVHQGGGVDGDALPHFPRGMVQGLGHRDRRKLRLGCVKKWSAGGGQPDAFDLFHPSAAQALVDRIVLAVDGQKRFALAARFGGDQFSGRHQAFLVGQPDRLSRPYRFVGGFEPGHADDRADHEIHIRMSGHPHGSGRAMHHFNVLHSGSLQPGAQNFRIDCGGNRNEPGLPAPGLLESSVHIAARGQSNHLEALGISFDHAERAAPNRARRSQDGNAFHEQKFGWGAARGAAYCITRQAA